jgi:sugar phosphate isomerase/epimerase
VVAAAGCALGTRRTHADQAVLERRQPVGLKISCSSLAFSDMEWDKALEEIQKLGFHYVDLAMFEGWTHVNPSTLSDPDGHGKKINAVCERLKIEPIAIHTNFALGDPKLFPGLTVQDAGARKTILTQFERVVTCAKSADIPLVNVMPGRFIENVPRETCLKSAGDLLTQMHALAARRGLLLSFENHTDSIGQDPDHAAYLLEHVPGLRLDYDPSHVVSNEYSLEQTAKLMRHVAHVGIRNAKPRDFNLPLVDGELSYPIRPFLDAFIAAKVNAYVSVEYFRPEDRGNIPGLKAILEREMIPVT